MGRHMDIRTHNREIFEDTMNWIRGDRKLTDAVRKSQAETKIYPMDELPALPEPTKEKAMVVKVTKERSFIAAENIKQKNPAKRVAVLNFASATNPGGGVARGSSAQEESLCRCSTLYPCLDTPLLWNNYYGFHRKRRDVRYTDTCVYTPGILVIKQDGRYERLREEEWFEVDIITCAAPNLRERPYNAMNPGMGTAVKIADAELLELHKKRARKIMSAAAASGADNLILGAFGCGAFQNPPEIVANAYKEVLPEYQGYFDEVRFAVYCKPEDTTNYDTFKRVMG